MSNIYRIGPARLLVASAFSDAPENWTDTGVTVDGVTAQMSAGNIHFGKVSQLSRVPMADSVWIAPAPQYITGRLADRDATKMAAVIPGVTHVTSAAKDALKMPAANTAITSCAVILVPESEYGDDLVAMESSLCVWFENATITVDMLDSFDPITDGDTTAFGYSIRVESLQGSTGIGYPMITAPELNPQGALFAWQPALDGLTPLVGEGAGTFTRATTATYIDDDGVVQSVGSGVHRIQDGGLLLEPQRTNLVTYSEALDNGAWGVSRASISANATTAPNGTSTADKIIEDSTASATHYVNAPGFSATTGQAYTVSFFAKKAERSWVVINFTSVNSVFGDDAIYFDLASGTVGTVDADISSHGIQSLGNGWFRVWATRSALASATATVRINLASADNGQIYTGNGSSGLYAWGAQVEQASYPTSYIPTSGSTATRNADALTIPFTAGLPATAMSVLWKVIPKATPDTADAGLRIGQVTATELSEYKILPKMNGTASFTGPSESGSGTASGGPTFVNGTEDDIIVNVSISGDTIRTYNGSDVAQSTAAIGANAGDAPVGDIISRSTTAIACVLTGMLIVEGALTPAQIRKYLR